MKITALLNITQPTFVPAHILLDEQVQCIQNECSQFISHSVDIPLVKILNNDAPFVKLKSRKRNNHRSFIESFNAAFDHTTPNLHDRALFAHGNIIPDIAVDGDLYYMFPINGFNWVTNHQVVDSGIYESVHNSINNTQLLVDLIKHSYHQRSDLNTLHSDLLSESELMFYNCPYSYAINAKYFDSYDNILHILNK